MARRILFPILYQRHLPYLDLFFVLMHLILFYDHSGITISPDGNSYFYGIFPVKGVLF